MAPVDRTEAQFEARKNHYLERIGNGKPKAKGTKSNPYKGKDLAKLLRQRFNNKQKNNNAPKLANINELPQLVENEANKALRQQALSNAERINKPFTTSAAQVDKQLGMGHKYPVSPNYAEEYSKLLDEKDAPKTWTKYAEEHGRKIAKPQSGVVEADRRATEIIKNKALADAEAINKPFSTTPEKIDRQLGIDRKYDVPKTYADDYAKLMDEKYGSVDGTKAPKTWTKYAEEHGKKYTPLQSGVVEADRRATEAIKNKALADAEAINKPFSTTPEKIDRQLGIDRKYDVPKTYADDYAKLMDEKYGKIDNTKPPVGGTNAPVGGTNAPVGGTNALVGGTNAPVGGTNAPVGGTNAPVGGTNAPAGGTKTPAGGTNAPTGGKKPPVSPGVTKAGEGAIENGIKDTAKKPGFFNKIGNFFKSKKGKWALAGAAIIGLAALCLSKCSGGKDKPVPPVPPAPTPDPAPTEPTPDKYCIETEEGKMPKSYTIQKGDYPSGIITDTYGVAYGTPEYKEIQKAVYEASEYQRNTNLKVGDKFILPDVTIGDKVYTADENAKVRKGEVVDNGLKLGRTKEVVKAGDKFYIVYCESGQRVPNEPAFDNMDKACERVDALLTAEKQEEKPEEEKKAA